MKKLVIIGSSGHGKVVADIARLNGYDEIAFLDDIHKSCDCSNYPVIGGCENIKDITDDFFIAVGNSPSRERLHKLLLQNNKNIVKLIHPKAVIGENVKIGKGSVVMAGAVINPCAVIGEGCIINTCASVDHDSVIDDFVHVAVGAHLCGTVSVGASTWIGAGAVVINNLKICNNCTIGAGAVVVKNIEKEGTYVGVPARII